MDDRICDTEKHERNGHGDRYRDIFQVEDFCIDTDLIPLFLIMSEFYFFVNEEDVYGKKSSFELEGGKIECYDVEARVYAYLHQGCKIKLVWDSLTKTLLGFLVYQPLFEGMVACRIGYLAPELQGCGLMQKVVNSLGAKHVLFQTRKKNPPQKILEVTKSFRQKIHEDDHFNTWLIDWKGF